MTTDTKIQPLLGLTNSFPAVTLPRQLSGFRDFHSGKTLLVCGCGASLNDLRNPENFITIGVNDVGHQFDPDYLVVLNPKNQFKYDRFRYVQSSRARAVFTQLSLGIQHPNIVRFKLGKRGGTDCTDITSLPYTRNSPYVALCLAIYMGANRIGLIGVDFTDDHFFAQTGRHPLTSSLKQINQEYAQLAKVATAMGVEIFNLSPHSQLTAFPKRTLENFDIIGPTQEAKVTEQPSYESCRIFIVHYQFLSCGDVLTRGIENAARDLGIRHARESCDDPKLLTKVKQFSPDLLFVIHGRKFRQRWGDRFAAYKSAVWLLDEPYEVDDTVKTSAFFDFVFLNDPSTLHRHHNAHYLPVAYDPHVHKNISGIKRYDLGFIGGGNPTREKFLLALKNAGLLSYIVGGPWAAPGLKALCLSKNIPPTETTALYQQTRIIVNVFRDRHHFNRQNITAQSLNPRVYEALACGALVISEDRTEFDEIISNHPLFYDEKQLVSQVVHFLNDEHARLDCWQACFQQIHTHTYEERLRNVLKIALGLVPNNENPGEHEAMVMHSQHRETTNKIPVEKIVASNPCNREKTSAPTYSILMVVHNSLAMVRMSILRTLKCIANQDARLVVVDNASTDGSEKWLQILADRNDIQLIRYESNLGHGPGLEAARQSVFSPFIVTLDSDAFPLSSDWLVKLKGMLNDKVKVAGIGHHRDYIHPSCLMIASSTLKELSLTFLDEKDQSSNLDVAERISVKVKECGYQISPLDRTGSLRRGSVSEPVYLGSDYGNIVYHQWYTTRSVLCNGGQVDDVPPDALEKSLAEVLDCYNNETRELIVVVGLRVKPGETERLRNAQATLLALNHQDLERWRYRVIVVEQDSESHLDSLLAPLVDKWIFAYNPGPYNRGWGFNIGAAQPGSNSGVLCLMDADILVQSNFLRQGLTKVSAGVRALKPYSDIIYLDPPSTQKAITNQINKIFYVADSKQYKGRVFSDSQGGCIFVDASLYNNIGGHDERFRGWGEEDREFWQRLARHTKIHSLSAVLFHLDHPRPNENDSWASANRKLIKNLSCNTGKNFSGEIGNPDLYLGEKIEEQGALKIQHVGMRDWENWHIWSMQRIENILNDEMKSVLLASERNQLARLVVKLGEKILDVGCGPGAIWMRLNVNLSKVFYVGVDITFNMLTIASRHFPETAFCQADGGQLPFASEKFDVVVLRHVIEHLPYDLMISTVLEALRVACRAVVIAFFLPPTDCGEQSTQRDGENFIQTQWKLKDLDDPIINAGWKIGARRMSQGISDINDQIWVIVPGDKQKIPDLPKLENIFHESPKISIIMPTYHRQHTIHRTIKMILAQTHQNWELIIIDNEGYGKYSFEDPRIRVFEYTAKSSASYARNCGIKYATGDLVCFFDDDDEMFPNYLSRFAEAFQKHVHAKMICCGMFVSNSIANYSYATPECCMKREYVTPSWDNKDLIQDQRYFRNIIRKNKWSKSKGDIVTLKEVLCRALTNSKGGLRSGHF